jgi:hypothetical protein
VTELTTYQILAIAGETEFKRQQYWFAVLKETGVAEVKLQWFQKIQESAALYTLTSDQEWVSKDSIICSGVQLKHMWNFKDLEDRTLTMWKLVTSMQTITTLHEEQELQQNTFSGLPMKPYQSKNINTNLLSWSI